MYGKMKEHLSNTLAEIKEAGLYKEERLIESAQQAAITVKGKEVLNFCANNYLGLSNHPRLIAAAHKTFTKNWKLLSPTISRQKTPSSMLPASMPMAEYSNPFSPRKMLSSPIH